MITSGPATTSTGRARVAFVVTGQSFRAVDAQELPRNITPETEFRDLLGGQPNVLDYMLRLFAEYADGLFDVPRRDISLLEEGTEAVLTVKVHIPVAFGGERDPVGGGGRSPHGMSSEDGEVARVLSHGSPRYRLGRARAVDADHARRKLAQPGPTYHGLLRVGVHPVDTLPRLFPQARRVMRLGQCATPCHQGASALRVALGGYQLSPACSQRLRPTGARK